MDEYVCIDSTNRLRCINEDKVCNVDSLMGNNPCYKRDSSLNTRYRLPDESVRKRFKLSPSYSEDQKLGLFGSIGKVEATRRQYEKAGIQELYCF